MTNATDFTALAEAVRGRVDELQRQCDAATKGPWRWVWQNREGEEKGCWPWRYWEISQRESYGVAQLNVPLGWEGELPADEFDPSHLICLTHPHNHGHKNAEFIAAARTALPALLTYARGLLERWAQTETVTPDSLARQMHSIYEIEAVRVGWVTQAKCQVPFDDLPAANKQVMLGTAEAVLAILHNDLRTELTELARSLGVPE